MRVFLDTNVLASAFGTRGLCADLYREVILSHVLISSASVLAELRDVLTEKFRLPESEVSEVIEMLESTAFLEQSTAQHQIEISDRDDCIILSSAIEGNADVFVTGDKEVQELEKVADMTILTPRDFWERQKGTSRARQRLRACLLGNVGSSKS